MSVAVGGSWASAWGASPVTSQALGALVGGSAEYDYEHINVLS